MFLDVEYSNRLDTVRLLRTLSLNSFSYNKIHVYVYIDISHYIIIMTLNSIILTKVIMCVSIHTSQICIYTHVYMYTYT